MKVTFQYRYGDYIALVKALEKHGRFAKYSRPLAILVILLNFAASALFVWEALSDGRPLEFVHFANSALALLIMLFIFVFKPLYLKHYYKKQMLDGKEVLIEFVGDGLEIVMPSFKGQHQWDAIVRADEVPEHFLLWINKVQAYCVPKRGFENASSIKQFRELLSENVEKWEIVK